ncbi:4245_t:CDS:2 [Entrophospora sp. SA101]|nr:4245_t:CDS:2 [Entrophospora sp. SA101]
MNPIELQEQSINIFEDDQLIPDSDDDECYIANVTRRLIELEVVEELVVELE